MRRSLILFFAAGLLFACNNPRNNDRDNRDRYDNRDDNTNRDNRNDNTDNRDNRNDRNDNNNNSNNNRNDNVDTRNDRNDNNNNTNNNNYNRNDNNNTGARWAAADEDKFTGDCVRTATPNVGETRAKEYCSCMLGKLEKLYPTYDDAERKMTQADMQPLADECNGKGQNQNQNQYGNGNNQ